MKKLLIITLVISSCFAQYQQGKIDMHGGNTDTLGSKSKSFSKQSGLNDFKQIRNFDKEKKNQQKKKDKENK